MTEDTANEVTRRLARFAVDSRPEDIPAAVRHEGVRSLLNCVGCMVGGSRHDAVEAALAGLAGFAGTDGASVLGRSERLDPMHAALVNGISSAVLDFDATQFKHTNIHPSGPVLPALFALAETRRISGTAFLHAYLIGIEVACRVANGVFASDNPGWHVTGVAGGFGAAAAVGRLLGLDELRMVWALGIAATQAAGLREMYGTMCKSFTPGRTAQNGLTAAALAARGFTSAERGIEGARGFARVLMGRSAADNVIEGLGRTWEVTWNIYKPFPCAIVTHAAIDGCLRLRRDHALTADRVTEVDLVVSPMTLDLAGKPSPVTGLESKFSVQHAVAAALVQGSAGPRQFSDEAVRDPAVLALRERVQATVDGDLLKDQARVALTLTDGRQLGCDVVHALGSLEHPMSDEDIVAKVRDLAEPFLSSGAVRDLIDCCLSVERLEDSAAIVRAALPPGAAAVTAPST